jgi:hypothetical protein
MSTDVDMRTTFDRLKARVKGEYVEMPGLRLSIDEASRLWNLEMGVSDTILRELADRGFLTLGADARYRRPTDSPSGARVDRRLPVSDERATRRGRPGGRQAAER